MAEVWIQVGRPSFGVGRGDVEFEKGGMGGLSRAEAEAWIHQVQESDPDGGPYTLLKHTVERLAPSAKVVIHHAAGD